MGSVEAVTKQTGHLRTESPQYQDPPVAKPTDTPITKQTKNGSRKGASVSFDTGTIPGKDTRYQAIRNAIETGKLRPSTNQLRKHWQCSYETAAEYLASMAKEGLLDKNLENNHYRLKGDDRHG